jgi:regulator of protease activity HflC (stomatin/prohibitin superfamily)
MRVILDEATDPWGIKVNRVELKSIIPPREIQDAMEKQMKAERERRESILRAEGEKRSAILVAEGQKESVILAAEADKQSKILAAEAEKEVKIREAEGEAEAIERVQTAVAVGLVKINDANPSDKAILLKSYETLARVADGKATKIVIPSDLQSVASLSTVVKALVTDAGK